jgi:hypothetical protein
LQRKIRHAASPPPTTIPRSRTAVTAYSEHVGKNLHVGVRFSGDNTRRYSNTGNSTSQTRAA